MLCSVVHLKYDNFLQRVYKTMFGTWNPQQTIWAAAWQNQQNDCAPSKDSDQLGNCPVWSESSLCAQWVAKDQSFLHAVSEDSDQPGLLYYQQHTIKVTNEYMVFWEQ